jgi:nucleoredoxin
MLPLTTKEIGLMLRGGDSNAAVMQELGKRHFVGGALSVEDEQKLRKAGASDTLIAQLSDGLYALSPEQSVAATKQIADVAQRRANETARVQTDNAPSVHNVVADALKGRLVRLQNGSLVSINDDAVDHKRMIALYFSAHWCGPCRNFTPQLVDYYNRNIAQHPEVEFVFVSDDRSADAMQDYMREAKMPWPAIEFTRLKESGAVRRYAGSGIPCLVLVDSTGRVVSDTFEGKQYVGPQKVLGDLDKIFQQVPAAGVVSLH